MENPTPFYGFPFAVNREAPDAEAQPRIHCEGCGGADFDDGDDGFFYCRDCGGQSQNMLETACADEDLFAEGGALYSARFVRHSQSQSQLRSLSQFQTQSHAKASKEEIIRSLVRNLGGRGDVKDEERPLLFEDEVYQPVDFGSVHSRDEKIQADGIRLRYVQGMQLMIQMQCKELVEGFGVSRLICGIAGVVWLRYLAALRVFDEGWADKAILEAEAAASERHGEREEHTRRRNYKSEPCTFSRRQPMYIWDSSLKKMISLHSSLAITFLACHIAREPILPTDLVKWALEGKLPYISAFVDIDKSLGSASATCPLSSRRLFRPICFVGAQQLEATAGSIAQCIGLHLPPVNFYAVAQRYLKELSLPLEKILPHACRIYEWSMPAELWLSANSFRLPTRVCVMSILIVSIRILYGIHGHGIWERSLSHWHKSSPSDKESHPRLESLDSLGLSSVQNSWKTDGHEKERHTTCSYDAKVDEVSDKDLNHTQASQFDTMELLCNLEAKYNEMTNTLDYLKDFKSYLRYCKDIVFAGIATSYEEEKLIERLWEIYEKREEDDLMVKETVLYDVIGNRKRSRDEDGNLTEEFIQRGDDISKITRVGAYMDKSSGAQNFKDKGYVDKMFEACVPDATCMDNVPDNERHVAGEGSRCDDERDVKSSRTNDTKYVALARMKLNMEENGFEYLPPRTRQRSEDYLHYRRKKKARTCLQRQGLLRSLELPVPPPECSELPLIQEEVDQVVSEPPLITPSQGYMANDQITLDQISERCSKGLCFYCDEKYTRGHRC